MDEHFVPWAGWSSTGVLGVPWNMIGFSDLGLYLGLVERMFWRCWLRRPLVIGADLGTYLRTNVAVRSGQVMNNPLSVFS